MFAKPQTLVYDILPPTTAIVDYATELEKLSANEQFFDDAQTAVISDHLLTPAQIKIRLNWVGTLYLFFTRGGCVSYLRACLGALFGYVAYLGCRKAMLGVWVGTKLQALVYDILPSTTAVFGYAIGPRKLSANEQFFVCFLFVTSNLNYIRRLFYVAMLLTSAQIKPKSFESTRNFFLTRGGCVSCLHAFLGARLRPQSYQYPYTAHRCPAPSSNLCQI